MNKSIKEYGNICVQSGFIQGLEAMAKQLDKIAEKLPLAEISADSVFGELRKRMDKTISDLKQDCEKLKKEFEAEHAKDKEK